MARPVIFSALLLVAFVAVPGVLADDGETCGFDVQVVYSATEAPRPVCSSHCSSDQSGMWFGGVAFRTFPDLTETYGLMVQATYDKGTFQGCTLVPYESNEQLMARKEAMKACIDSANFPAPSADDSQGPSDDTSVVTAPAEEATTTEEPTTTTTTEEPTTTTTTEEPTTTTTTTTEEPTTTTTTTTEEPTTTTTTTTEEPTTTTTTTTTTEEPTTTTTSTTTTTTTTPPPIYVCDAGQKKYKESKCYYFSTSRKTWTSARSDCLKRGMDLAKIQSYSEQLFVSGQLRDSAWININDRSREGRFRYADGSSPSYTRWDSGEPNNWLFREDCTEMKKGSWRWNDKNCGNDRVYVCEKKTRKITFG